ncbi:MAG: DNA polymerase III delta subunit [Planctomycetota bacterium]|jgi:DNA polymerase III delta subunit
MAAARQREQDPASALAGFQHELEKGTPARGYLVRGDERWFRTQCVDALRAKCGKMGYEVCVHDAVRGNSDFSRARLNDDLAGGGLFAAKRLIVVRTPENELKKGEDGKPGPVMRAMLSFLQSPDDVGTLLLDANSLRADNAVSKAIKASGGPLLSFRKLYDSPPPWKPDPRETELVQWFLRHARSKGVRLDPNQAAYVCAATGNDLAALDDQLVRLQASSGGRIEDIVGWSAAIEPWTVADRVVDGPLPKALAAVEMLFLGGHQDKTGRRTVEATALIAMLVAAVVRAVRQGHGLARELSRTSNEDDALAAFGVPARGPARERALARAKVRSAAQWRNMLDEALELERCSKGGGRVGADDIVLLALRWLSEGNPSAPVSRPGGIRSASRGRR